MSNKRGQDIISVIIVILAFLVVGVGVAIYYGYPEIFSIHATKNNTVDGSGSGVASGNGLKIASWNLQVYGTAKASNSTLVEEYRNKIRNYDIVFVQEIRDITSNSFATLCYGLVNSSCKLSTRAGRTANKEQYGLIYRNNIKINSYKDYNPDTQNRWERPPIEINVNLGTYNLTLINIHTKPEDTKNELKYLSDIAINQGYVVVLGDLNADCSYYSRANATEFSGWNWIISDTDDTTVSQTSCAYDRIIMSDNARNKLLSYGIDTNITAYESDHYLIWFKINN